MTPDLRLSAAFAVPSSLRAVLLAALPLAVMLFAASATPASAQVKIFQTDSREEAVKGTADGVAIGPLGQLELSPRVERLAGLDEPFVFAAATAPSSNGGGWLLGTGNEGKVFHVSDDGVPQLLATLPEPTVFAVLERANGEQLAAGSPEAKVYRIEADQALSQLFDAEATYVWDLAEDVQGRLLVATGLPGKVLRVELGTETDSQETATVETLWESPDDHVRALHPRADGSVWIGTAGQGRIVRLAADGTARTVYDAAHPEVLAFAEGLGEGGEAVVYAALLASEASLVDLSNAAENGEDAVTPDGEVTVGSRGAGFQGPRSVVLRLVADGDFFGRAETVAELSDETIHSLHASSEEGTEGLWIGTGQDGALYRLQDDVLVREDQLDDRQIVALLPSAAGEGGVLGAVTTDGASVYRIGSPVGGSVDDAADAQTLEGTYTSKVLDTEQPARFGVFRWRGTAGTGRVAVDVRAGASTEPDATWTDWISVGRDVAPGVDVSLAEIGNGRFLQWRTTLSAGAEDVSGDGEGPRIDATELSYRQLNQAPEISSFAAKAPGQILVSQSFNPTSTVYEPWSPNQQGIFVTIDEDRTGEGSTKTLWKRGWRTLEWAAEDANGDALRFSLEVRPDAESHRGGAGGESDWLPVVDDLDQAYFSFDATVLPDGVYRFRLVASDGEAWPEDEQEEAREISEPVTIDHAPPQLVSQRRDGDVIAVRVADELSPIQRLEISVDAGAWRELRPEDGLADGHEESLRVPVPSDTEMVLLRAMDASFNVVTWSLATN